MLGNWNVVVVSGAALFVTAEVCLWFYRWLEAKNTSQDAQNVETKLFHKVLFFPEKKIPCRKYLLTPKVSVLFFCFLLKRLIRLYM